METWDNCWAFSSCTGLKTITINEGVSVLGWNTFQNCYNVTKVIVWNKQPIETCNSFNSFADNATLYVPSGCIAQYSVAEGWKNFKEIKEMPPVINFADAKVKEMCVTNWDKNGDGELSEEEAAAVTSIGTVFQNQTEIETFEEFRFFTGVTNIGQYAISGCTNLSAIILPANLKIIDRYAFNNSAFGSIVIPDYVTSIGNSAFRNCANLISVKLGKGSVTLGKNVFRSCTKLSTITFDGTESHFNGEDPFRECSLLASVIITDVSAWCKSSFYSNPLSYAHKLYLKTSDNRISEMTNLVIPEDITTINSQAFYGCTSLISVVIPSNVETIGTNSFSGCTNMKTVKIFAETPLSTGQAFGNRSKVTLYVPYGSKQAYQMEEYWEDFNEIIEMDPEYAKVSVDGLSTFSFPYALDFANNTEIKAYIANGFNPSTGELVLTRVFDVPAGEGLLIKGIGTNIIIPCTQTNMYYSNLLKGVTKATTVSPTDGSYSNFILANGLHGIGFYTLSQTGEIAAGKAYLQLPISVVQSGAREIKLRFDDEEEETTGIEDLSTSTKDEKGIYTLSGQRVENTRNGGLYVVNGRKVLVK